MSLGLQRGNILGTDIQTAEIDDNAITLAKTAHHTGEGIIVYDASGVPAILDGGTSDEALKMNAGGTALEYGSLSSPITILGSGTFTTSGAGVNQVGNFAITSALGSGKIIFHGSMKRTTGAGATNDFGIHNSTGDVNAVWGTGNKGADSSIKVEIMSNPDDATNNDGIKTLDGTTSKIANDTTFNTNAAETFYVTSMTQDAGTLIKINWIAYHVVV